MQSIKTHPLLTEQKARLMSARIGRTPPASYATRILIIDQDRQVGIALSFMLAARRFDEVRAVRSAKRAVTVTEQFHPEIVFLDLELPVGGAFALARKLAHDGRKPRPRLFALAADVGQPVRDKARAAGFERCLVKPVSNVELDQILGTGRIEPQTIPTPQA
jgi:CheY-like chemotaxis protein